VPSREAQATIAIQHSAMILILCVVSYTSVVLTYLIPYCRQEGLHCWCCR
jgi:hypothetical protein